jgi:uncharacterized protein (TIGR02145 family)
MIVTRNKICFPLVLIFFVLIIISCKKVESGTDVNIVTDIDGNIYHTVTIGKQVWMVENLKVTRYRNGDSIATTIPSTIDVSGETNPKYQWAYGGDESNVNTYGRLYTWYVINDNRKVCPLGWHIPSESEMFTLREFLSANGYDYDGTIAISGTACAKSLASRSNWILSTTKGAVGNTDYPEMRDKTGFSGLPGGCRGIQGIIFNDMGYFGAWWSSSEFENAAMKMSLHNALAVLYINIYPKNFGLSVRCIRD